MNLFPRFSRYSSNEATSATRKYLELAKEFNMNITHMALAFVTQQPFVTSNIIGATSVDQLKENIESIDIDLNEELLSRINAIHGKIPNPSP